MTREDTTGNDRDPVINGVRYPLVKDKDGIAWRHEDDLAISQGLPQQIAAALWEEGFASGMGETQRFSPNTDGYAFCVGWDAVKPGRIKLSGRRNTVTAPQTLANKPTFGFEEAGAGSIATAIKQYPLESSGTASAGALITHKLLTDPTKSSSGAATGSPIVGALVTGGTLNSSVVAASYATSGMSTPITNNLVLCVVENYTGALTATIPDVPTSAGLTWVQVQTLGGTVGFGYRRLTVFRALGTATAGELTVTFAGVNQQHCKIIVSQFSNVNATGTNGSGAVGTAVTKTATSAVFADVNVGAYTNVNNRAFGAIWMQTTTDQTVSDWVPMNGDELSGLETVLTDEETSAAWHSTGTSTQIARQALISTTVYTPVKFLAIGFEIISDVTGGQLTFVTESITPTANNLLLLAVHNTKASAAAPSAVSGLGLTWTSVNTQAFNTAADRVSVYKALGTPSPVTGAVTITFAATQTAVRWSISEFGNVDVTTPVIQSAIGTGSGTALATTDLAAFGSSSNGTYGVFATNSTSGVAPNGPGTGSEYSQIDEVTNTGTLFTEFYTGNDVDVEATAPATVAWGGVGLEIKASIGTIYQTGSIQPTIKRLVLLAVYNNAATPAEPTVVDGCGLTWTKVTGATVSTYRVTLYKALATTTTPTSTPVTITFSAAQTYVRWAISEFSGVNTTTPVVQSASNTSAANNSLTVTLSAGTATSATFGVFGASTTGGVTPGTDFTEIYDTPLSSASTFTEWKIGTDTSVDATSYGAGGASITQDALISVGTQNSAVLDPSTLTTAHTAAAGADKLLFVSVAIPDVAGTPTVATWNGSAMTVLQNFNPGLTQCDRLIIYYAKLGTLASPLTADVVITFAAGATKRFGVTIRSYTGVDQTTPFGTEDTSSDPAATSISSVVTSATGEICVDAVLMGDGSGGLTIDAGQTLDDGRGTQDANHASIGSSNASASHEAGAASVTMTWSRNSGAAVRPWAQVAVPVKPSGSAAWIGIAVEIGAGSTPGGTTGTISPYLLNGQFAYKMAVDSTPTVTASAKDLKDLAAAGNPAKFGTDALTPRWYIPTGTLNTYWTLTAVGSPDTWVQDTTNYAQAFARFQDGAAAKLLRGYAVSKADLSADGSSFNAADYDVGEISSLIVNMVDTGTSVYVAKTDGLYRFTDGVAYQIIKSQPDDDNGCGLLAIQGTDAVLYNDLAGLWLFDGANLPTLIGPDANDLNQPIANVTHEPRGGRHLETARVGKWYFSVYQVTETTTKTYIMPAYRQGQRWVWHTPWRYDGVVRGVFPDTSQRLWSAFVTDNLIGYHQLDEDGCPDPGRNSIGHAAASTDYPFYLPEVTFPAKAYLHSMEVLLVNAGATVPVQLQYQVDGASPANLGSTLTTDGLNRSFKGTTAVGGYRWRPIISVSTTSGYVNTTTAPLEVRAIRPYFWTRPQKSDRIHFVVDCGAALSNEVMDSDAKTRRDQLKALARGDTSGPAVLCLDPDGNTLYLHVFQVSDGSLREIEGELHWIVECQAMEWVLTSQ